jgi:hypothetical protein
MFTKITVQGGHKYVGVDERLRWARHDHPDLQQTSEQVARSEDYAEFKVSLLVPSTGARGEGHGDCYKADFGRYVQKAEENALGNALDHLGYSSDAALAYEKRSAAAKDKAA